MAQGEAAAVNAFVSLGILIFVSSWINYSIDRTPLDLDKVSFPSPDGKYVANFKNESDGWYHLQVKDLSTGRTDDSAKVELTPIFSVQWTGDSKTIATVSHIAHGSAATLFHLDKKRWSSHDIFPPSGKDVANLYRVIYEVAKLKANEHDMTLTYEIGIQTKSENAEPQEKDYFVTMLVDPNTNKTVVLKRTSIETE